MKLINPIFLSLILIIGCSGPGQTFQEKIEKGLEIYVGQEDGKLYGGAKMDGSINEYAPEKGNYTGSTTFGLVMDGIEKDLGLGGGGSQLSGQFSLDAKDIFPNIKSKEIKVYCKYEIFQKSDNEQETLLFSGKKYSDSFEIKSN